MDKCDARLSMIYDFMLLKEAYRLELIPHDGWEEYVKKALGLRFMITNYDNLEQVEE